MYYALVNGEVRQPHGPDERAACRNCGGALLPVPEPQGGWQWRHAAGDCDPWSEPQGTWHLAWKERFPVDAREVPLQDGASGERHVADVFCTPPGGGRPTIVEFRHGPLTGLETLQREVFFKNRGRLYWVLHVHDEPHLLLTCLQLSLRTGGRTALSQGKEFTVLRLPGRSVQFIEQWKRSGAYVVLDVMGQLYHFATAKRSGDLVQTLERGEFALRPVRTESFIAAVRGGPAKG